MTEPAVTRAAVATAAPDAEPIRSGADYIESLRGRRLKVYLFGERVDEPVDHPAIPGLFGSFEGGKYNLRPLYRH